MLTHASPRPRRWVTWLFLITNSPVYRIIPLLDTFFYRRPVATDHADPAVPKPGMGREGAPPSGAAPTPLRAPFPSWPPMKERLAIPRPPRRKPAFLRGLLHLQSSHIQSIRPLRQFPGGTRFFPPGLPVRLTKGFD